MSVYLKKIIFYIYFRAGTIGPEHVSVGGGGTYVLTLLMGYLWQVSLFKNDFFIEISEVLLIYLWS